MKIGFIIGYPSKYMVSTWAQIKRYKPKYATYDEATYHVIKALEYDSEFEAEIIKSRKKLGIPLEGFNWKKYEESRRIDTKREYTKEELDKSIKLIRQIPKEVKRINRIFKLDERVSNQIDNLIKTGCVYPIDTPMDIDYWLYPDDELPYMDKGDRAEMKDSQKSFQIHLYRQLSKNELVKFIKDNWTDIEARIRKLPKSNDYYFSRRDLRIVELRDKDKLQFNQIADKIIEEFDIDERESKINQDSVKTAYRRAKLKIFSITHNS